MRSGPRCRGHLLLLGYGLVDAVLMLVHTAVVAFHHV
jgi:hypothetical protein